jgi:hypothetical protein
VEDSDSAVFGDGIKEEADAGGDHGMAGVVAAMDL